MVEMTLVMATVLQHYQVAPSPEQEQVQVEVHTAIRPRGGLRVEVAELPGEGKTSPKPVQPDSGQSEH